MSQSDICVSNLVWSPSDVPHSGLVLTSKAKQFVSELVFRFESRRRRLLHDRHVYQSHLNQKKFPDFPPETESIRAGEWQVDTVPPVLRNRTLEITGPAERKMMINALNSQANGYMCDLEDSLTPSWNNIIQGHINLYDFLRGQLEWTSPTGKVYQIEKKKKTSYSASSSTWMAFGRESC